MPKKNKEMEIKTIKSVKEKSIKINKVQDYYQVFVDLLKVEDEYLHYKEHLWVMGIDKEGFVACVYIVALGGGNVAEVSIIDIFVTAVRYKSANVVIAHNHTSDKKPNPSEQDIDFTNKLFHRSRYLELNLLDHIIISRLSISSKKPIYYSFLEKNYIDIFLQDITYQAVDDVKNILDEEKKDYGRQQKLEEKIEIVQSMLEKKYTLKQIIEVSKFNEKEIKKIEKDMQIDLVKNMLKLSPDEIDEIIKISKLTKKEVLKIQKDMK